MGINCAPLLADLFQHYYEEYFLQVFLKNKHRNLAQTFNSSFRFIDHVLSLNHSRFGDYLIYPNEFEVKDATDTQKYVSYLEIVNLGRLKAQIYHKYDDFTFPIVNFLFISSNIPSSSAYGVYISQHIRYSMVCAQYNDFLDRVQRLTKKLLIAETCRAL
jgi:hypothetical protein